MDRFYLFTWRVYASWLPGQAGFVGNYVTSFGRRTIDHTYDSPTAEPIPALARYAAAVSGDPTWLSGTHAAGVLTAIDEVATRRQRTVHAAAVMADHVHLMFAAESNDSAGMRRLRNDWKSLIGGSMNRRFDRRRWWVRGGSTRWYRPPAFATVARYVWEQPNMLCGVLSPEATEAVLELEARNLYLPELPTPDGEEQE
jgi:REP element-mobilizing transposase RayT